MQATVTKSSKLSKRQELIDAVTSRLQEELHQYCSKIVEELDSELLKENKLKQSESRVNSQYSELLKHRGRLDDGIIEITRRHDELITMAKVLEDNPPLNVELMLTPYDELSLQYAKLQSDVMTYDDALFYMNKSMSSESRKDDLSSFMKESRKLARQQFVAKVHLQKIRHSIK